MNRAAVFVVLIVALAGAALAVRLPQLDLRPVHVDEAVHAYKFNILWETGTYKYDLNEYHGPTLYYLALPAVWLSGAVDFGQTQAATYRMVPLVFGVGLILLLLLVADGLGRPAAACAGALTVVSPAMVFYSRYYIQEMLLVFFTFAVMAAGWRYVRTKRAGWAVLAGGALGFMHATKETCVIALGCMAAAVVITVLWSRRNRTATVSERPPYLPMKPNRDRKRAAQAIGGALAAAVLVSVVLFSGFFTNLAGPLDSVRAFTTYFQRAGGGGVHEHPWHYYLHLLTYTRAGQGPVWSEGLIVALGLAGTVAVLWRKGIAGAQISLLRFLVIYTLLMSLVYSAIPYKTPWCLLSPLHGLILLAGVGAVALVRMMRHTSAKVAASALLTAAAAQLGAQAQRSVSEKYCAHPGNPYVYATTLHGVVDLTAQLEQLAEIHPDGRRMLIKVMVDNCWPLPWYLRRFERVGYWEGVPDEPDADVILASSTFESELNSRLRDAYQINTRALRRDERLLVYVRQDLWDAFVRHLRRAANVDTQPAPK